MIFLHLFFWSGQGLSLFFWSTTFDVFKTISPAIRYNLMARTPSHKDFHFYRGYSESFVFHKIFVKAAFEFNDGEVFFNRKVRKENAMNAKLCERSVILCEPCG